VHPRTTSSYVADMADELVGPGAGAPVPDELVLPAPPVTWDDAAFDHWSKLARLRFLQRSLASRIPLETEAVSLAVDRHPGCSAELARLATSIEELVAVTADLLALGHGHGTGIGGLEPER